MEGYTQSEYHMFTQEEDEEDEEIELKKKIKYKVILKEDEFDEDD